MYSFGWGAEFTRTSPPSKVLFGGVCDQAKQSVVAHSDDGIRWTDKQVVLRPRSDVNYENAGVIALNVWKTRTRYRAIYAAIGSKFGAYSICEAVSNDGVNSSVRSCDEKEAPLSGC